MPDLDFEITSADVKPQAAVPTLVFRLQISNDIEDEEIYAVGLKSQVRIESVHRKYDEETKPLLRDVFGSSERWDENLKSLYWKQVTIPVPRFTGQTQIEIPLECSEDLSTSVGKYFYALEKGEIPLTFIFKGSVFYKGSEDTIQVTPVPWEKEASYNMPVSLWNNLREAYFPDSKYLRVPHELFDKLYAYKTKSIHPTINKCLESLVDEGLKKFETVEKDPTT